MAKKGKEPEAPKVVVPSEPSLAGRAGVLEEIRKKHGAEVFAAFEADSSARIDVIPSGSFALDKALGRGGWARGRVCEIYGPESSGKTTLTLQAIANAQKLGLGAAFVDAEHALDVTYAEAIGVNMRELAVSQPDCGEQALEVVDMLSGSGEFGIVVVDSVAALTPRAEIDGEMGDSRPGAHARLMSQAMRKLIARAHRANCLVLFLNQLRIKIGVLYGSPITTTGGEALKFYCSARVALKRMPDSKIMAGKPPEQIGNTHEAKVTKNKLAPPYREAQFDLLYGVGIDRFADMRDAALDLEIITQAGSWCVVGDQKFAGRNAMRDALAKTESAAFAHVSEALAKKGLRWV